MNFLKSFTPLAIAVVFLSCGSKSSEVSDKNIPEIAGKIPNPETAQKNSPDFHPAFAGQTRAPGMRTATPYRVEVINSSLKNPWGIINLPDGRFLITQKSGTMQIVSADGKNLSEIGGFPKVDDRGQGGMQDVALDPDFKNNKIFYWTFAEPYQSGNILAVAKGKLSADEKSVENPTVIFRAEPSYNGKLQYGSRLLFDKDGHLFVSTGERSDKEIRGLAQKTDNDLGKILKITKDGKPAPGNPFEGKSGARPEIYSYGHRNPEGLDFDAEGNLWELEFGPRGGDEVNLILPGKNYGWPDVSYGIEYSGEKVGAGITQKNGTEQPVYYWDPVVSPSGIAFYTGNIPEWKNNLFIACLSGEKIVRLKIENKKVTGEEWLLTDQHERIRDVLNGADGNLYAISDGGKLYKISKK